MENVKLKMDNDIEKSKRGMTMRGNVIADKSLSFAVRIVRLYRFLIEEKHESVMSKQLLRSGTSVGANVREASSAQSKPDFISKCAIALKECDETGYWIDLLERVGYLSRSQYDSIEADRKELFALLTTIIKTSKASLAKMKCKMNKE